MIFLNKKNKEKSFTLAEMLVVITIIIILTTIIIIGTEGSRALSRDKKRMADLAAYQVALQEYYSYNKAYPFQAYKETAQEIDCVGSDNWSTCNAPQTVQDCNAMVIVENKVYCLASENGKTCTCYGADYFLERLKTPEPDEPEGTADPFLDPLPKDPKADEDTTYAYIFPLPNKGKSYKIAAQLERDDQSMANDGGTNPPEEPAFYEVFSTLGASLAINSSFFEGVGSELACEVRDLSASGGVCPTNEGLVLRLSAQFNAHAGSVNDSNYLWGVCCSPPPPYLTIDSGFNFLKLSGLNNAHVAKNTGSYAQLAYIGVTLGSVQCEYLSDCDTENTGMTCLASISADTNGHISSCTTNPYPTKVCCLIK